MTELILQALYSGLLQGGSYALIALGLALVFGSMKVINLAHGELVLLSAYIAYTVESGLGWNPIFAIPVALIVVCLASVMVYFVVGRIKKDREANRTLALEMYRLYVHLIFQRKCVVLMLLLFICVVRFAQNIGRLPNEVDKKKEREREREREK